MNEEERRAAEAVRHLPLHTKMVWTALAVVLMAVGLSLVHIAWGGGARAWAAGSWEVLLMIMTGAFGMFIMLVALGALMAAWLRVTR